MEHQTVCVAIFDTEECRFGFLDEDVATTLIAVCSEDPADWCELVACWPRYTTRAVPEFASHLPIEISNRDEAIAAIQEADCWIVLDLIQKRFLSSKVFHPITRNACFAMHTDENGKQHDPLSVNFAPWWELREQVDMAIIEQPRQSPMVIPRVDRAVLFGQPLIDDLASRVLAIATSKRGKQAFWWEDPGDCSIRNPFYPLTIEVHREWLMSPRADLGGKYPRQMLHGARDWLSNVVHGHRMRFERSGAPLVALPKDVTGYLDGPIGDEEMALYFSLCRELISAAWHWTQDRFGSNLEVSESSMEPAIDIARLQLTEFLAEVKTSWLANPFEGGSPPAFIIECSRRRVPRGSGLEIVGMSERQSEQHILDCDCPICNMMADGAFGPSFAHIDGHHLELDDEFAFSMLESREDWEAQQQEYADLSAKWEREKRERNESVGDSTGETDADDFESAWNSGGSTNEPFPSSLGGESGNLRLAFLLAEVVGQLQQCSAPDELVQRLNKDFSTYRTSELVDLPDSSRRLSETLETVANQFPELVARAADFQSQLAERLRKPVTNSKDDEDGIPF